MYILVSPSIRGMCVVATKNRFFAVHPHNILINPSVAAATAILPCPATILIRK